MCWVIPPASPAATSAARMASSSEVLPWSTWPITVTTGGRMTSFDSSTSTSGMYSSTSNPFFSSVKPNSVARKAAVSASICWLIVAILPACMSLRMRSAAFTPIACDSADTEIDSSIRMTFLCSARSVICVLAPFFVGFFFLPRIGMYARSAVAACSSSLPERFFAASSDTGRPAVRPRFLSRETSMNSRSRPSEPGTTFSSRTSPSARGPGAAG